MILYTMMPQELIFPSDEAQFVDQKYVELNGVSMIVEKNNTQGFRIVRLLCSDPQHYLNNDYMPGSTISLNSELY